MTSTYIFPNDDSFWGDNVTRDEAERLGDILAELAGEEFPEVNFESRFNISNDAAGLQEDNPKLEQEIQIWHDRIMGYENYKVYDHPDMNWDLRQVIEDNAGGLWAVYGNGQSAEIQGHDSPEDIETSDWLSNSTLAVTRDPITPCKVVFDNSKAHCDGWGTDDAFHLGAVGKEYRARHIDSLTIKDLWEVAESENAEHLYILDENGVNVEDSQMIYSSDIGAWLYADNVDGWKVLDADEVAYLYAKGVKELEEVAV